MAASNGTITMIGLQSKRTYVVDLYLPDAVGGLWGFAPNGASASTSPTQFRVNEDCVINDVSIITGTTAVGVKINVNNSDIAGGVLRYANFLNTLSHRPVLQIPLKAGDFIGGTQI